jgi:hypothetical protein
MVHDLLVRGFDDKIHSQLGELAKEKGVSINSIVRDAVDQWLKQQSDIPKKHYLLIYSNDDSILGLLKSMDRLAKESDLFRCFCGPPSTNSSKLLSKLNWYNAIVMPYYYDEYETLKQQQQQQQKQQKQNQSQNNKSIMRYCSKVRESIVAGNNSNNKQVCCIDFLINDIAKSSLHQALAIEKAYDDSRIPGLMYCTYKTETLLSAEIKDLVELFEGHDQVFILKQDDVYKLHITKENVHKLFLN